VAIAAIAAGYWLLAKGGLVGTFCESKEQLGNSKWQSAEPNPNQNREGAYPLPGSTVATDEPNDLAAMIRRLTGPKLLKFWP
jgi:hypothetical protein